LVTKIETHGTVSELKKWGTNWKDLGESFSLWTKGERALRGVEIHFNSHEGVVIKEDNKKTMTEGCYLVKLKLKIRYTN
jgi:hypothetical protein